MALPGVGTRVAVRVGVRVGTSGRVVVGTEVRVGVGVGGVPVAVGVAVGGVPVAVGVLVEVGVCVGVPVSASAVGVPQSGMVSARRGGHAIAQSGVGVAVAPGGAVGEGVAVGGGPDGEGVGV